ncbi:FtsX-like permease family protein, partial [bacterium]|nr:FtsX-like permease family protein [bacterium]
GICSGILGVLVTYLLSIPINVIINSLVGVSGIANLNIAYAFILIAISVCLTLISGLIPSLKAAKKDPVTALRTE